MPRKIRQLKTLLRQAGFAEKAGKGSHMNFWHPLVPGTHVTLSRNDGDDAARYHEKQVTAAIDKVHKAQSHRNEP
jgi:predicted RNA binding protein YcfA (HicA-like mRNA interferase family)